MVAEQKHTPGPWIVRAADSGVWAKYPDRTDIALLVADVGRPSAISASPEEIQRWDADRRLIAAAPDLLAALLKVSDGMGCWCPWRHEADGQHTPRCLQAQAAIAAVDGCSHERRARPRALRAPGRAGAVLLADRAHRPGRAGRRTALMTAWDVFLNALIFATIWTPCIVACICLLTGEWPWTGGGQ